MEGSSCLGGAAAPGAEDWRQVVWSGRVNKQTRQPPSNATGVSHWLRGVFASPLGTSLLF